MSNPDLGSLPFTRRTAYDAGLSRRRFESLVHTGHYRRVLRNVYVSSAVEDTCELRLAAAALVVSAHAVACDRTAAWLHGVDSRRFRELDGIPPLETYVLRGHEPTERPEVVGGTRDLRPCDWAVMGGVRVTTPVRTAMDLGCKLPRREAMAAMNELMRLHAFSVAQMDALLPRYRRRRGVIQARQLVPLTDGRLESPRESWTLLEIADHGLPLPEPQVWVDDGGVQLYRLDFAYRFAMVAIEYDGEEFHTSAADRERDRARRDWLRDHGWIVIVLTKALFFDGAEVRWIVELRSALESRAPHLLLAS